VGGASCKAGTLLRHSVKDPVCAPCRVFCVKYSSDPGPQHHVTWPSDGQRPTAVAEQGRWPHVRHPRLPQNPPTQSGPRTKKISGRYGRLPCTPSAPAHVQGVELHYAIFASEEVSISRWGVKERHKGSFQDSHIATIMLTTPCSVSGDHPSLTLCANILLPLVCPPVQMGWDTALFIGKYPMFA
jgi:hypothetical protein